MDGLIMWSVEWKRRYDRMAKEVKAERNVVAYERVV